jgi:uncharacterized protein (PEP-CTERM system associated)
MKFNSKLLLPALAVFSGNCQAFDWLFDPRFSATERYTDNLRMQINPTRDNFVTTLSPGIVLGYLTENQSLNTAFTWNQLIYHGQSELDFSEKILNLNYGFQGERYKVGLDGQYAEQSTLNNSILQIEEDLFTLQLQIPRTTKSISPNFLYNITERDALQLAYNYTDVSFERSSAARLTRNFNDYDNQQWSSTFTHTFTERFSVNLSGSYAIFNTANENPPFNTFINNGIFPVTTGFSQKANTITYQAGLQYTYDERTRVSVSAGIRDTETEVSNFQTIDFLGQAPGILNSQTNQSFTSSGNVYSGNLNRKFDWGSIDLNAGQQLSPASTNGQRNTTNFSADTRYNLSERWVTALAVNYVNTEQPSNLGGNLNNDSRTNVTFTPSLQWRWTPEMNLRLSYSYRQLELGSLNETAESNNVQLQFSYQPQINRQVK